MPKLAQGFEQANTEKKYVCFCDAIASIAILFEL
jgi:hypothetical protein